MKNYRTLLDRFEGYKIKFSVQGDENDEKIIFINSVSSSFEGYELNIKDIGKFPLKRPRSFNDDGYKVSLDYSDNFFKAEKLVRGGQPYFGKKQQKELKIIFEFLNENDYENYLLAKKVEDESLNFF